ncbi:hypothetical protein LDENG_00155070, partial [Lucifuga dentata]
LSLSNIGRERVALFSQISIELDSANSDTILVLGGDWNCTIDPSRDRSMEPHPVSAGVLGNMVRVRNLIDTYRFMHSHNKGLTWCRLGDEGLTGARLDRFYISAAHSNRLMKAKLFPTGFSDHHMVTLVFLLSTRAHRSAYW